MELDGTYYQLEMLKERLNFEEFETIKASTSFETSIVESGKSRTWHKINYLRSRIPTCRRILYLTQHVNTIIFFNKVFSGFDWYCIQERDEKREPNWIENKFWKNCLSGPIVFNHHQYWNDGRLWEEGMTDFNVKLLSNKGWSPDFIFCDMGLYSCLNNEKDQLNVISSEIEFSKNVLAIGGTVILKLVGVSEKKTQNLLLRLISSFNKFELHKADGSNPLNGEVYCLCYNFISKQNEITDEHRKQVNEACQKEMNRQITEIQSFLQYSEEFLSCKKKLLLG